METEYTIEEEDTKASTKKPKDGFKEAERVDYKKSDDKNYIPEGYDSKKAFLRDMRAKYEADIEADDENRREAIDDKKFSAGEQWDPLVLEHRKGLPNLVINSVPQFTAQLVGDWRQNRNGIKVLPTEDGDVDIAKIRGDLMRSIETRNRAHRVYDQAFESAVQCGDGAFRVCVDWARDSVFDQDIGMKPIEDCLSVVWDHLSVDPTGKDAAHVFVDDSIPKKEFESKWGKDLSPSLLNTDEQRDLRANGWFDGQSVRVTEYWRMIERDRTVLMFEDGFITNLEEEEDDEKLGELIGLHGPVIKSRRAPCRYAQMHLVTGHAILDGPYEYKLNRVPIIRMSGRVVNIAGRRVRYGLVRFMKDPVRLRNFWRSTAAEQLGYAPKAQWIATEGAVEGREDDLRKAHLSRDPLLIVNDEAEIGRNIQRVDPPTPEMALHNEAQVNAQDMKDVTGIHDASLGIRSNETSGKAINARQREGDIASFTFFDNANESILEAGDVINQLIPQIYDSTRTVRIIGEDEELRLVRINDPMDPEAVDLGKGHYDVTLSTGTSFQTRRVEAAEAMMNAVQVWPEIMSIAGDLVVKAQDWPGAEKLAERLKKAMPPELQEQEEGAPPPVPPEIMQQLQELQAALQEVSAENEELKADHSVDQFEAETKRMKVLLDAGLSEEELTLKAKELGVKTLIEAFKTPDGDVGKKTASDTNKSATP